MLRRAGRHYFARKQCHRGFELTRMQPSRAELAVLATMLLSLVLL
jgi:hypothetical protein